MLRIFRNLPPANNIEPARNGLGALQHIRRAMPTLISCSLLLLATAIILASFYWALFWGPEHRTQVDPPLYSCPSARPCAIQATAVRGEGLTLDSLTILAQIVCLGFG
jgi:hypothetical protein